MLIENLFAAWFEHVQIDIGIIGIPHQNDAQVCIEILSIETVNFGDFGLTVRPFLMLAPRDQRIEFFERNEGCPACVAAFPIVKRGLVEVFEGFGDIKEEDQVESYIMVEVPR